MALLNMPAAALAWLGRQGTRAIAVSVFLGLALPPLAELFKSLVTEAIFVLLLLAFLRVEPAALRAHLTRPGLVVTATAWIMLALPLALGLAFTVFGLPERAPELMTALMLQAAGPPIMSAPAFAALMGLDAALSLATLVLCVMVTPVTASLFAYVFIGPALALSPVELGVKLFLILAGSALVAAAIRRGAGQAWVERQRERIDGLNVILLFVFAVAVLGNVPARTLSEPGSVAGLTVLGFALALAVAAVSALMFFPAGRGRALAIGLAAANRNMGLMLAATGGALGDLTWLYFGLAQFPIYLLPALLKPLAKRLSGPR